MAVKKKAFVSSDLIYTTKTMADQTGLDQDTIRKYAAINNWGIQPGGPGTPRFFTRDDVDLFVRVRRKSHSLANIKVIDSLRVQ
jgi:DNA-binding transcriptional MerR regulator